MRARITQYTERRTTKRLSSIVTIWNDISILLLDLWNAIIRDLDYEFVRNTDIETSLLKHHHLFTEASSARMVYLDMLLSNITIQLPKDCFLWGILHSGLQWTLAWKFRIAWSQNDMWKECIFKSWHCSSCCIITDSEFLYGWLFTNTCQISFRDIVENSKMFRCNNQNSYLLTTRQEILQDGSELPMKTDGQVQYLEEGNISITVTLVDISRTEHCTLQTRIHQHH